ncbi:ABC transporter ATP-binding protein [uncultured Algimonas sp.]|uniref:ABC transporter ATP-binding protein n=1 Tax=uncultured Algimonas sp. TaxID=1547920 RepID=UPI002634FFCB|nr:ABC transporter ATP-binding protein [uncultured Algimonas sp.]
MGLRFENIHYSYGSEAALKGISLDARKGEILCLLGRSGCGKSTLLNLTAGLLTMQSGTIRLDGEVLASPSRNPPPEKRNIGLVFQDGALFPHLSVADNIGFGVSGRAARRRVTMELLHQIGLPDVGGRYPNTLSGGQQQRVAVARALAPDPAILLLDEPFASIDVVLRRQLREETRRLAKRHGATTILVTHDPEEALEVADRIAVMEEGRITQVGTARELYDDPASLFVGLLVGNGTVLPARVTDGYAETSFGCFSLSGPTAGADAGEVDLLIRPHCAVLEADPDGSRIIDIRQTGRSQIVTLQRGGTDRLLLEIDVEPEWAVGQTVRIQPQDGPWPLFPR